MMKTASLICTCLISLGLLAGCASNQTATGDRAATAASGPVKMAGPEENWANFAGAVDRDRADVVIYMLSQGISPNTIVNGGDPALYSIAKAVHAEKLAFLSDIEGVYRDYEDKSSLITALTVDQANELIESGAISGGMIPKLQNCVGAIENGVSRVHILDGRIPHCLLLEIFTKKGIGTAILRNGEED